jgi:hypothetical protein
MKILKQIFLVTLAVWAVNARANYVYNETLGNVSIPDIGSTYLAPGQSGTTTFYFTMNGAPGDDTTTWASVNDAFGHSGLYQSIAYDPIFSSVSIDTVDSTLETGAGETFTEGTEYSLVVDWTISLSAAYSSEGNLTFGFAALTPNGSGGGANTVDWVSQTVTAFVEPEPVPEPSSAPFLGLGGLSLMSLMAFRSRK